MLWSGREKSANSDQRNNRETQNKHHVSLSSDYMFDLTSAKCVTDEGSASEKRRQGRGEQGANNQGGKTGSLSQFLVFLYSN